MRVVRWFGYGLLALTVALVLAAWWAVSDAHQREVDRQRYVFGPDAKPPAFRLWSLVDPDTLPGRAVEFYLLAACTGVPGLLAVLVSFVPTTRGVGRRPEAGPADRLPGPLNPEEPN